MHYVSVFVTICKIYSIFFVRFIFNCILLSNMFLVYILWYQCVLFVFFVVHVLDVITFAIATCKQVIMLMGAMGEQRLKPSILS